MKIDQWVQKIEDRIVSCPTDQSTCEGDVYWNDKRTKIEDLLMDAGVPPAKWQEVVQKLSCPRCRSPIDLGQFVGTQFDHEIQYEKYVDKALGSYRNKLKDFTSFLTSYPYLGGLHPIGRSIRRDISKVPTAAIKSEQWFRARRIEDGKTLTEADMLPPDPKRHRIAEGRFNHFGQSRWYLASTAETAVAEVTTSAEQIAWVQEWTVPELANVLDVRAWSPEDDRAFDESGQLKDIPLLAIALIFGDELNNRGDKNELVHPEYHVPRYVADAAQHAGFSGLRFRSTRSFGENLVIFDQTKQLAAVSKPRLVHLSDTEIRNRDGLFLHQGFHLSLNGPDLADLDSAFQT